MAKSHAKLADIWSAAWGVVRWAQHVARILSEWEAFNKKYESKALDDNAKDQDAEVDDDEIKMKDFVEKL